MQKACILQTDRSVKVEDIPIPSQLSDDEMLLKVLAVGQNPIDVAIVDLWSQPGVIPGVDFVGLVQATGSQVPLSYKGQICAGSSLIPGRDTKNGVFAEYFRSPLNNITFQVPSNITPAQAAGLPVSLGTVAQGFFTQRRLNLPFPDDKDSRLVEVKDKWILIWSGASAVGQCAVQVAKAIGLRVVATASPSKHDLLKSYGADAVFDYQDPDVVSKIKATTSDSLAYGFDARSTQESIQACQRCFPTSGPETALITVMWPLPDSANTNVKTIIVLDLDDKSHFVYADWYSPEDKVKIREFYKLTTRLLAEGRIKPLPITDVGGLENVDKAVGILRNKSHQTKLVHTVAQL